FGGILELRSVFAECVVEGFYVNVEVNRIEAACYGFSVVDVQRAVTSGIGGENVAENIEGWQRYLINVCYNRDFRDDVEQLRRVLVASPTGAQILISEFAKVYFSHGPAMIRDEDGLLTGYVYLDLATKDYSGFVAKANRLLL